MQNLSGKVAVVTGSSRGIGASIAVHLAAAGAFVVITYLSRRDDAELVMETIKSAGGRAVVLQVDVRSQTTVRVLFQRIEELVGPIHILVNNAGIYEEAPLAIVTDAMFQDIFSANVLSVLLTTQAASMRFHESGGSVINISSVLSANPQPSVSLYSATKAAIDAITRSLALELASKKIRVNAIAPGPVQTEGARELEITNSDFERSLISATPLGRLGQSADIAKVAVFLASDESAWMTGERIVVSGGLR